MTHARTQTVMVSAEELRTVVNQQVSSILKSIGLISEEKHISDDAAEQQLRIFLLNEKASGRTRTSVPELAGSLRLPIPQVDRVVEKLIKEGKVHELDD